MKNTFGCKKKAINNSIGQIFIISSALDLFHVAFLHFVCECIQELLLLSPSALIYQTPRMHTMYYSLFMLPGVIQISLEFHHEPG